MTEPKKVYLDVNSIEKGDNCQVDAYLTQKYNEPIYHSDTHLREWIEEENKRQGNCGLVVIENLLKYLNEQ